MLKQLSQTFFLFNIKFKKICLRIYSHYLPYPANADRFNTLSQNLQTIISEVIYGNSIRQRRRNLQ